MAVSNIERFDETVAKIFSELYLEFPLPHNLRAESFMNSPMEFHEVYGKEMPTQDDAEFFIATAQWLIQTGYIYGEVHPYIRVSDAVLTAKGLEVLKASPDSLATGPSIGEQLATATKDGSKELMRGLLAQALTLGTRLVSPLVGLTP
jgi:hypothetical protein